MVRNYDKLDKQLTRQIADNPGITFSQLFKAFQVPPSTLRYRLTTLQLSGTITVEKTRNANAYYLPPFWGESCNDTQSTVFEDLQTGQNETRRS